MIPFGLTEKQFVKRYKRYLERVSSNFIDSLRKLFLVEVPDSVIEAEVQIFLGDEGVDAPNAWIYFQGINNKIDSLDSSIFPGKSMELPMSLNRMDDFDEKYYSEEFGGTFLIANTTKEWLAECWWKAGGWDYPVPVKVWVHDEYGDGESIQLSEHR